jgi:hypothetical protein
MRRIVVACAVCVSTIAIFGAVPADAGQIAFCRSGEQVPEGVQQHLSVGQPGFTGLLNATDAAFCEG